MKPNFKQGITLTYLSQFIAYLAVSNDIDSPTVMIDVGEILHAHLDLPDTQIEILREAIQDIIGVIRTIE